MYRKLIHEHLWDPIFLGAVFVYTINTILIRHFGLSITVSRYYLNDFFLVPCTLPPILFILSIMKVRRRNQPATAIEVFLCLIVWSVMFELVGPQISEKATPDILDVLAYWLGGISSWFLWNFTRFSKRITHYQAVSIKPSNKAMKPWR